MAVALNRRMIPSDGVALERGQADVTLPYVRSAAVSGVAVRRMPDLFIVGAPKCGTTSLQRYLETHPDISFGSIKEPLFFCGDHLSTVRDYETYLSLFPRSGDRAVIGEASTLYLYYEHAVPRILEVNPEARFIVMVRNPIDMALSYHNQTVYSFEQAETDFEKAWFAAPCEARPGPNCRDRKLLDYESVCRLGRQVERLSRIVDRSRLCIVVFDDLCAKPAEVYASILRFLELPMIELKTPKVFNARMHHRFRKIGEALLAPGPLLERVKRACQRRCPVVTKKIGRFVLKLNRMPGVRTRLDPRLRNELASGLGDDVRLLSHLIDRDLEHWLRA